MGIDGKHDLDKAKNLETKNLDEILRLRFKNDANRRGNIRSWVDGDSPKTGLVRKQLQSYVLGSTVQDEIKGRSFRAFVVVIVGSRQILIREMGKDGKWASEFQLVNGNHLGGLNSDHS